MSEPFGEIAATIPARYVERITAQWRALNATGAADQPYRVERRGLPAPVWVTRGLPDDGARAWEQVRVELRAAPSDRPISIYLHVPFCASRCGFCDCYAFPLRRRQEAVAGTYTDRLLAEIDLWAGQAGLSRRPVTTVHLGGGTPTCLGMANLARLTYALRARAACGPTTEWALETTSSSLDPDTLERLCDLGYRRLHVGVQSLQDEVRAAIGRREPGSAVVEKLTHARAAGWIASVDLIVGLPGQTPRGLLADIDRLIDAGVEGFSIYELQHSRQNHRFFEQHNLASAPVSYRYLLFQLAFQHLEAQGFSKNVFNHLAKGRDRNLYFTFPKRGEDLLALGAIADGVFGNYHYRHTEYRTYTRPASPTGPGLLGGLRRTPREDALHRLEVQIMAGQLAARPFEEVLGKQAAADCFNRWLTHRMVAVDAPGAGYTLTPNGAWFAGQLVGEAAEIFDRSHESH